MKKCERKLRLLSGGKTGGESKCHEASPHDHGPPRLSGGAEGGN